MRKYMVLCLTAALLISGCLNQTNESADTSTETEEYALSTPDRELYLCISDFRLA